jgi:hypothetical protein
MESRSGSNQQKKQLEVLERGQPVRKVKVKTAMPFDVRRSSASPVIPLDLLLRRLSCNFEAA